jgi:hypothetical protein
MNDFFFDLVKGGAEPLYLSNPGFRFSEFREKSGFIYTSKDWISVNLMSFYKL